MDIRTLLICFIALLSLHTVALVLIYARERGMAGIGWLAGSFASSTVGAALGAARGVVPELWSIVAGNALIMVGYLLLHQAVTDFLGMDRRHVRTGLALLLCFVLGAFYFTFVDDDTRIRIALFSALITIQVAMSARLLLRAEAVPGMRLAMRSVGTVLAAFAVLNLLRALLTLREGATADFMHAGPLQAWSLLAFIVTTASVGFGFVWMTTARLRVALQEQAVRDDLTGLLNRRGFMDSARAHRSRAEREGRRLLLIFADLDGLKEVNDSAGHAVGDRLLAEAAELLRQVLPPSATLARLGGDEFCGLLALDDGADEEMHLQRLERRVEVWDPLPGRGFGLGMSAAAILVEPDETGSLEELLHAVDDRMYAAKRTRKQARRASGE